jgi:general secretion pathway protein N
MMLRARRLNRFVPSVLVGAVAAALLVMVVFQLDASSGPVATPVPPAPAGTTAIPPSQALVAVSLDPSKEESVVDRPLFSPTRRPPPPPPSPATADPSTTTKPSVPQPPPINFSLVGIVRDRASSLAIIQPTGGKVMSLREGQSWSGWTLVSIGVDSASFRNGAAQQELVLDFKRSPPPPAPATNP